MSSSCEISVGAKADGKVSSATADSFSWRRVGMIARFYFPVLRKQLICMPLVVFVCVVVMSYNVVFDHGSMWIVLSTLPVTLMYVLSPIALARRDCRSLGNQLPVLPSEKLAFLVLYFSVVILFVTSAGTVLSTLLLLPISDKAFMWLLSVYNDFEEMFGVSIWNPIYWPAGCFFQYCVLYGVITAKKNRMAAGFLWLLGAFVCYQLVCAIAGFVIGLSLISSYEGTDVASIGTSDISPEFMHWILRLLVSFMTVGTFVLIYLIYRRLKTHGF